MNKFKILSIIILFGFLFIPRLFAQEYNLTAEELFTFGKAFLIQNRYTAAREEFEKCLMLNPQHNKAKKLLALCEKKILPERDKAILLALEEAEKKSQTPARESEKIALLVENESLVPPIQKGAWTLNKGVIYVELYTKYFWHKHKFDDNGDKRRWAFDGKGNELRTELKLEYGLTDKYTLMLYTVAKEAHWKDSFKSSTQRGFVEMWPGVKHLLFEEPFICSLQAKMKFPFDYSEEATPALGKHQIDAEIKLLTAQPWPNLPGYTKFELGFRGRNEEPTNEIPYFFEFGYNLNPKLIFKTTLDGNEGLAQTGGLDEDWLKYTVGPIIKIEDLFNIEFGFGHTFAGKNTSAAKEVYLTLSSQW